MAEQQAQQGIGELFVEFGAKGLPSLLKGLNSLSASFLLNKNAATEAVKPITDLSKKAAANITSFDKFNAITGLSIRQLQQLDTWAKLNNTDFGDFIGQIQGLQQNLLNIRMGTGGNIKGFALLGLDPREMSYKKPLEALELIRERVQQVDEVQGNYALQQLALSEQLLYAWKQQNNEIDKRLLLSDKEIENLKAQQTGWNKLNVTVTNAQQKFISDLSALSIGLENLAESLVFLANLGQVFNQVFLGIDRNIASFGRTFGEWKESTFNGKSQLKKRKMTTEQQQIYEQKLKESGSIYKGFDIKERSIDSLANLIITGAGLKSSIENIGTNINTPPWEKNVNINPANISPPLPNMSNGNVTNITVTVDNKQNITTSDPIEAARLSNQGIGSTVQQAFNAQNQFGL